MTWNKREMIGETQSYIFRLITFWLSLTKSLLKLSNVFVSFPVDRSLQFGVATPLTTPKKPLLLWGKSNNRCPLSKHITKKNGIISWKEANIIWHTAVSKLASFVWGRIKTRLRFYLFSNLEKFLFSLFHQHRTIAMLRKLKEKNRSSSTALLEGMMIVLFAVLAFVFFL